MQQAFIFDLDGVLTDTAAYHYRAWKELADELGLHFGPKDNELLKGVSRLRSLEIILERNGVEKSCSPQQKSQWIEQKNARYQQLIRALTPDDILPGVLAFLEQARREKILLAVASASKNAADVLRALQISDRFDYIADAQKIRNPKPHPEIFLTCANALQIPPAQCVAFEDAQAGIEAIKAAGMFAVGIGVHVTTVAPDLMLCGTQELSVPLILEKSERYQQQQENRERVMAKKERMT